MPIIAAPFESLEFVDPFDRLDIVLLFITTVPLH